MSSTLEWIHSFDRFDGRQGFKPGLERMEHMLAQLDNPHHDLRFLHVAGTNGKGSTCAYLAAMLEAAGYRVGLYTSPYLTTFYDRMVTGEETVQPEELDELAARLRPVVDATAASPFGRPTEFEVVTTLALLFYRKRRVDFVVWETGLGGRLDATNVVTPLLTLITNVGHDHKAILGDTIEQIAAEKAGILKPGVPLLTTASAPALVVLEQKAAELDVAVQVLGRDFLATRSSFGFEGQRFTWADGAHRQVLVDLDIAMLGAHQILNASLAVAAIMALRAQGIEIADDDLRAGLRATRWAGRLEVVGQEPLLLLDGAHNPEGAQVLHHALAELLPDRRLVFVIGILADKAIPDVLAPLVPLAAHVIVTRPDNPRAADPAAVAAVLRSLSPELPVEVEADSAAAIARACALQPDAVIITGTLFLISEVRQLLVN